MLETARIDPSAAPVLTHEIAMGSDYETVRQIIEMISLQWRDQPSLAQMAAHIGMEPTALQKLFTRWAGLSPKAFLQAVTLDHARRMLDDGVPLLDIALETGLSGPSRLHDLFVTHEAMSPGELRSGARDLVIRYGFHASPFGMALVMATDRGLCGLAFCDPGQESETLADMCHRWPFARFEDAPEATARYASHVFDTKRWQADQPLRVVLIGTDFQISVWEALMQIPMGRAHTYSGLAQEIGRPKAARAVGAAVGANPVSFVVPCHRALGKSGALTGYHWGLTRKRAMLGWEAGQLAGA